MILARIACCIILSVCCICGRGAALYRCVVVIIIIMIILPLMRHYNGDTGRNATVGMLETVMLVGLAVTGAALIFGLAHAGFDSAWQHIDCAAWADVGRTGDFHLYVSVVIQNTGRVEIRAVDVHVMGQGKDHTMHDAVMLASSGAISLDPGKTVHVADSYAITGNTHAVLPLQYENIHMTVEATGPTGSGLCEVTIV